MSGLAITILILGAIGMVAGLAGIIAGLSLIKQLDATPEGEVEPDDKDPDRQRRVRA